MNKVMKVTLNAAIWAADLLCTPAILVVGAICTRNTRMEKVVKEAINEIEFAKESIGDISRLTNEQYEELINVLSNNYEKRVLGKAYFVYKIREYQANTLDSKYWKKYMAAINFTSKKAVEGIFTF